MSLYASNQVKTTILDPVYNRSNQRCEFRLPNDAKVLSNMRLGNIGASANATGTTYNGISGGLGVIQSIHLMDSKNTVLDQLLEAPIFNSFKNFNKTNQEQKDRNPNLHKNNMAMFYGGISTSAAGNPGPKITLYDVNSPSRAVSTYDTTTARSWVSVADMLPLLRQMLVLDTVVLRDLKLVIEWSTNPDNYIIDTTKGPFATVQPILIYDEIIGGGPSFENVEYTSIEHDRVKLQGSIVSSTDLTKVQPLNARISGYNNKTIKRLLVVKSPLLQSTFQTTNVNHRYSNTSSVSCFKEQLQLRVNGSNVFAGNGLTSENERLAMLNDVWGNCSCYNFGNGSAYLDADATDRNVDIDVGNNIISELDYYGIRVNSEISDLQLRFQRTVVYVENVGSSDITDTAGVNQDLNINLFAEVNKALISDGNGGYLVQYV